MPSWLDRVDLHFMSAEMQIQRGAFDIFGLKISYRVLERTTSATEHPRVKTARIRYMVAIGCLASVR